jgi:hypothetical protein
MGKNLRTWLVMAALAAGGCGDDGSGAQTEATSPHPYKPGETTVIDQDGQPKDFADTTGAGCLEGTDGKCVDLGKECAPTDKVDVILDKDGTVVDVVCYPTGTAPVSSGESRPPGDRTYENNEVVVLDDKDDGDDINGNVDVDSTNVTLWGNGPEVSVINGNVVLSKNNGVIRGVRIKGNVTLSGNNATLLLSVVEGNVIITGNNNVVAASDLLGNVEVSGQNDALVSNRIAGDLENKGSGLVCSENVALDDKNSNKSFDEGEAGAAISCDKK